MVSGSWDELSANCVRRGVLPSVRVYCTGEASSGGTGNVLVDRSGRADGAVCFAMVSCVLC